MYRGREAAPCDYPGGSKGGGRHFPHRGEEAALDLPVGFPERILDTNGLCPSHCRALSHREGRVRTSRAQQETYPPPRGSVCRPRRVALGEASAFPKAAVCRGLASEPAYDSPTAGDIPGRPEALGSAGTLRMLCCIHGLLGLVEVDSKGVAAFFCTFFAFSLFRGLEESKGWERQSRASWIC